MLNYTVSESLENAVGLHVPWLSSYPDFVAFGISVLVCAVVSSGARISGNFITVTTIINLLSIVFVSVVMFMHGSMDRCLI